MSSFKLSVADLRYAMLLTQHIIWARQHSSWCLRIKTQRVGRNSQSLKPSQNQLQSKNLSNLQKGVVRDEKDHEQRRERYGDNAPIIKPPKTIMELVLYFIKLGFVKLWRRHVENLVRFSSCIFSVGYLDWRISRRMALRSINFTRSRNHYLSNSW